MSGTAVHSPKESACLEEVDEVEQGKQPGAIALGFLRSQKASVCDGAPIPMMKFEFTRADGNGIPVKYVEIELEMF